MTEYPKALYRNGECLDPHAFVGAHHAESRVVSTAAEEFTANGAGYWPIGQAPKAAAPTPVAPPAPIETLPPLEDAQGSSDREPETPSAPAPAPAKNRGGRPRKVKA